MRPYVGITISTLVACGIFATFVYTSSTGQAGANLPTTELLPGYRATAPAAESLTLSIDDDGCFFVQQGDTRAFAVWPKGSIQRGQSVVTPGGIRLEEADTFDAQVSMTTRQRLGFTAANPISEGPLSIMTNYCVSGTENVQSFPIAVVSGID